MNLQRIKRNALGLAVVAAILVAPAAAGDPGLMLVAHGAPMPAWNKPVLDFGAKLSEKALATGKFKAVRTAMLEFAEPTIPTMLADLEAEGCDRVVVVPLFVAPSGHTTYDLPAVLGQYTSPSIRAVLEEEGAEVARPKVPIIITPTLSEGGLLAQFAADQVRKLSTDPKDEAVVIVAHGDEGHHALVDAVAKRVTTYCCGQAGIDYGDWAFIEMGQSFMLTGAPALSEALDAKKHVLVVGLYVSSSANSIISRMMKAHSGVKAMGMDLTTHLDADRMILSTEGVVTHPATLDWALKMALDALE